MTCKIKQQITECVLVNNIPIVSFFVNTAKLLII
jgi:hypothetical protein